MSGLIPDLTKPLVKLTDPLGLMPDEMNRTIADPLGVVTKPEEPKTPSQKELYDLAQKQRSDNQLASAGQVASTKANLSRASMGAQYLGS